MSCHTDHAITPDPIGLAVARAAHEVAKPNTVILFGSRARGDHRVNSDVDLLVIYRKGNPTSTSLIKRAIKAYFTDHPPEVGVDIIPMEKEKFDYSRRAKNHVAAQALRDGIIMSDEKLDFSNQYQDDYPDSWPDVKDRIKATYRPTQIFRHPIQSPRRCSRRLWVPRPTSGGKRNESVDVRRRD